MVICVCLIAHWEPTYDPEMANMSIAEYAKSRYAEFNWLTRYLSNEMKGDLTNAHVLTAMDVVRRKFLVGLLNRKEDTMERIEQYFGWKYSVHPVNQEKCRSELLKNGANANTHKKEKPQPGTSAYELLASLNKYDIQLYNYIEKLFDEQAQFVKGKSAGFRLDGSTCCKCEVPPQC